MDQNDDSAFLGVGWKFPPQFDQGGRITRMVSEVDDIRESLRILLSTTPGERVMLPAYGCGLRSKMFESVDEAMITELKDLIERAILFFEPRITLEAVDVAIKDILEGRVEIDISYRIRTTNTRSNMVFPFYLLEATNA
jgi:phage baseplate assembly protein W